MSNEMIAVLKSWLNVFLAALISGILTGLATDVWDWRAILFAALAAVLPVIRNWLSPSDPRYGRGYVDPEVWMDDAA